MSNSKGIAEEIRKGLIEKQKLLECLRKESEFCSREKFSGKQNARFYLGRETVLSDIIAKIESGTFDDHSLLEENERLKEEKMTEWEGRCFAEIEAHKLREELEQKEKVLEWYGGGSEDGGEKARSILDQYKT